MSKDNQVSAGLDEISVEQWLAAHPDFFKQRERLLAQMNFDHACGQAESLILRQLTLLRQQLEQMDLRYQQLLGNARENEARLRRTERLLIALIEAQTTEELYQTLQEQLYRLFHLPETRLWSYAQIDGLNEADKNQKNQQLRLLGQKTARCLTLTPETCEILGLNKQQEGSAAICLLSHTRTLGLMVLAHREPSHFSRQQDTLFVEYVGSIISRLLAKERLTFKRPAMTAEMSGQG